MKILILVAHSDDETIGCGGTIHKHVENNDQVFVACFTDGISSRCKNKKNASTRRKQSIKASKILGFNWINQFNFEDNALDKGPLIKIVKKIENIKKKIQPDIIYTHSKYDLNVDHRVVFQAVLTAFRPQPNDNSVEIRCMEIASATDFGEQMNIGTFKPNLFINIKNNWKYKEKALKTYIDEMKAYPHSRSIISIKNQCKLRGNQVGIEMAESFEVIRRII